LRSAKTAENFFVEFAAIDAADKDVRFSEKEKTPYEMLIYQIGWMDLLKSWDDAERAGQTVITPSPDINGTGSATWLRPFTESTGIPNRRS
jgi:hypothetical protein